MADEYKVSNPHPGFGKDPNILNEFGHTKYPMWVNHPTQKIEGSKFPLRVLVKNAEEEKELLGNVSKKPTPVAEAKSEVEGWGNH